VTVWGGTTFPWGSGTIIGLVAGSIVMIGAVVWWERRAPQPLFPPRVFSRSVVRVSVSMTFFVTATMFAVIIYLPVYLQLVDGVSATRSGVLLLPLMVGMLTTSITSGRLVTRLGRYRVFPICGTALMTVGMWLFTHLEAHTSFTVTSLYMVVFGVGMGMTLQIVVVAVQNAVDRRDLGSATSAVSFFRNIGAACGSALLGAVLAARLGYWLPQLVPAHSGLNLSQSFTITPKALHALPPAVRAGVVESFVRSLHVVFIVGIPLSLAALACALVLKEMPLRDSLRVVEDRAGPGTVMASSGAPVVAPADGEAPAPGV